MNITLEKDGVRMSVGSEIQASAFVLSGWKRVEATTEKVTATESKPKVGRPAKK